MHLHYYFYFMDAELGLVYLRVPTWAPFRLQFYCNDGHSWLAPSIIVRRKESAFTAAGNAFVRIDDWQRAQELADALSPDLLHRCARALPRHCAVRCSTCSDGRTCWSLMQVREYATDLVFRSTTTTEAAV